VLDMPVSANAHRSTAAIAGFLAIADEQIGQPDERSRKRSVDLLDLL
jgi:hypothetical protein